MQFCLSEQTASLWWTQDIEIKVLTDTPVIPKAVGSKHWDLQEHNTGLPCEGEDLQSLLKGVTHLRMRRREVRCRSVPATIPGMPATVSRKITRFKSALRH